VNIKHGANKITIIMEGWTRLPDVSPRQLSIHKPFTEKLPSGLSGVNLLIDPNKHNFALSYDVRPSTETLTHLLADLILPRLLAYDGHFVLHCGTVNGPSGAFGFIGPSGHGKSTMTASLHLRGMPLMSDDAVVVKKQGDTYRVERIYPSLRLFPDSLEQLFAAAEPTAPVADYTDKRHVTFAPGPDSAPLLALFRLVDPANDINISRLAPAETCMALIANSFALDASNSLETRKRFAKATDVARCIPVYDLHYPRDYAAIPEVHARIFETIGMSDP
jgi:hypothetical protein